MHYFSKKTTHFASGHAQNYDKVPLIDWWSLPHLSEERGRAINPASKTKTVEESDITGGVITFGETKPSHYSSMMTSNNS